MRQASKKLFAFAVMFLTVMAVFRVAWATEEGQREADRIASFATKAIYNLDTDMLSAVLESYLEDNPNIVGLTVVESIDDEVLMTYFRDDGRPVYNQPIPDDVRVGQPFIAVSNFEGEEIGFVELYYQTTPSVILTEQERLWIQENSGIRVHSEIEWPPFNFLIDNEPAGYSIDFMNLLAEKTGLNIQYITGPSWNEFLEMIQVKKLEVMLNIVKTEQRQEFLLFTPPYANNPNTILSRRNDAYKSVDQLFGKTVAVPRGFFYEEILVRDYPQITVLPVRNMLDSMKAVSFGDADAAFGELAVFQYLMDEYLLNDLVIAGDLDLGDRELTLLNIATRKDLPILASILTKGVAAISDEETREIQDKWFSNNQRSQLVAPPAPPPFNQAGFIIQYIAISFAILVGVIFVAWLVKGRPTQLNIREILFVVFFVFVGLILSIGMLVNMLLDGSQNQSEIELRHNQSFNLAYELKQSSDDLTLFARLFAVTGDAAYENHYRTIIDIRDGNKPHPVGYTQSFWDQVAAGVIAVNEDGETYSIAERMVELGFSREEQEKLTEAKFESDSLVDLELVSMNAVIGRYRDEDGEFTISGPPDLAMARALLHGEEYLRAKARIMTPIDEFFVLLEWRTTNELNLVREQNRAIILSITALTLITIVFAVYAFFLLKRRIISPLSILQRGAKRLEDGEYESQVEIRSRDEVGSLADSFNSMARSIAERTYEVQVKQRQLQLAMDNMPGGMLLVDPQQIIILANNQFRELFELPETLAIAGDQLQEIINFQTRRGDFGDQSVTHTAQTVLHQLKSVDNSRYELPIPSGAILALDLAPTPDGGTVVIATDITERKTAEAQIRASEERIRALAEAIPDPTFVINDQGYYVDVLSVGDDESINYSALQEESLVGQKLNDVVDVKTAERFLDTINKAIALNQRQYVEYELTIGGRQMWFEAAVSSIGANRDAEDQVIWIARNISVRKEAEEKLSQAFETISGSIDYAARIQRSVLPDGYLFNTLLSDHMVLWEPRDVVGGDIYWCRLWGDGMLIILGDCTGHGVPGAFMSLIATGALDNALTSIPHGQVAELMTRMHQLVQTTLGQHREGSESDDGMELGICYLGAQMDELVFAGARFELYVVEDDQVETIRGTKSGIGYRGIPHNQNFDISRIQKLQNKTFYMTSDGLIDQVGGEKGRAFGKRRFRELLISLKGLPLSDQKQGILENLSRFQRQEKRRDDMSIIGFRI